MKNFKLYHMYFLLSVFNLTVGIAVHSVMNFVIGGVFFICACLFVYMERGKKSIQAQREQRDLEWKARERRWENDERIMRGLAPLPEIPLAATITRKELKSQYEVD